MNSPLSVLFENESSRVSGKELQQGGSLGNVVVSCPRISISLRGMTHSKQGMTKFEVLSRGSTFAVKSINQKDNIYHFLAPFHVTAPYLFPGYYPRIHSSSYESIYPIFH